jgi:hypothetical protein
MKRNCIVAFILWIALVAGYFYVLRELPGNGKYFGALAMGTIVAFGLMMITGVRYSIADWRAKQRQARGERPHDGDLTAAIGPVQPALDTLTAPFSGRPCVLYAYEIGPQSTGDGRAARDYVGFGMTRCSVRTPYGEIALGSFPVLEHVFENEVDRKVAAQYVANTNFQEAGGITAVVKSMMAVHTTAPPLKQDWKIGNSSVDVEDADVSEKIIAPGDTITAIGRYVAASNAIVSDTQQKGFLRLRRGGDALHVSAVPWNAIGAFFGGLALIAAANFVFFLLKAPY